MAGGVEEAQYRAFVVAHDGEAVAAVHNAFKHSVRHEDHPRVVCIDGFDGAPESEQAQVIGDEVAMVALLAFLRGFLLVLRCAAAAGCH